MSHEQQLRTCFAADLEIRSTGDGRTVEGIVVPYDREAVIARSSTGTVREVFVRGSLARTIRERGDRIKLYENHNHQQNRSPIGRSVEMREDVAGAFGAFRVAKTNAGDEALELVRAGVLDSFSVGFIALPGGDRWNVARDLVARHEIRLEEVSLTARPVYEDALVSAVRSAHQSTDARLRLDALTQPTTRPTICINDAPSRLLLLKGNQ
jgi:HK97 family phage prohead protease